MKQIITTKNGITYERNWDVKGYYSHLNIRIDTETLDNFKNVCKKKQFNYSDVVRRLMKEYVEKEGE